MMNGTVKASENGTKGSFDPKTYYPEPKFSSGVIAERLKRSILNEVSEEEAASRIELAAAYRMFALKGWNDNIYNHLTARVKTPTGEAFLINAFGLAYEETTASSLLTIDLEGNVIHPGVVGDIFGVNHAGYVIHSALHRVRPDAIAVMHSHFAPATGISAQRDGLKELAQTTHILGEKAYHDYEGIVVDMGEQERLVADVGTANTVFLRNHGIITIGKSIGAALFQTDQLMLACEIQNWANTGGPDRLLLPPEHTITKTFEATRSSLGKADFGVMEFCALLRRLDRVDPSYRL